MKISINKLLFHWYTKVPVNNKSKSVQLSLMWQPMSELLFNVDWNRGYGHIFTFNLTILGLIRIVFYKNEFDDHAGLRFQLNFFGLDFEYENKDIRHWDYDNDCWEEYPE